ncbi:MAG: ketoacid CoA transferase, partial [Pseudohongiellaceae bacterium]
TPLCVMDFTEVEKRMRLVSLHPGVTLDDVKANTGFELVIPDIIPTTLVPTEDELTTLRTRVDLNGLLRSG